MPFSSSGRGQLPSLILAFLVLGVAARAQESLSTAFAGGNGQYGCMFDLIARNPATICDFDLNLQPGTWTVEIYSRSGTHEGFVNQPSAWGSPIATRLEVASSGLNTPTALDLSLGLTLAAGERRAFYITVLEGTGVNYTNAAPGSTGAIQVSDSNLDLHVGTGVEYPFRGGYPARMWNGTIRYRTSGDCEPPRFQRNQADASLTIGGVETDGNEAAVVDQCVGDAISIAIQSSLVGQPAEFGATLSPLLPRGTPGTLGSDRQTINIDAFHPTLGFLNGGAAPLLLPFPGSLQFTIPNLPPVTLSVQMVITSPGSPEGVIYSQGATVRAELTPTVAGPTGDDEALTIDISAPPLCFLAGCTFYGQVHTQFQVASNGRITFGTDDLDFSPTASEALQGDPFIGAWSDLDPSSAGSIRVERSSTGTLAIVWDAVAAFAASPGTQTGFEIGFDPLTANWTLGALDQLATLNSPTFLGMSLGNQGATNPGPQLFAPGSGQPSQATAMLYELGPANGLSPIASGLSTITFAPTLILGQPSYTWVVGP